MCREFWKKMHTPEKNIPNKEIIFGRLSNNFLVDNCLKGEISLKFTEPAARKTSSSEHWTTLSNYLTVSIGNLGKTGNFYLTISFPAIYQNVIFSSSESNCHFTNVYFGKMPFKAVASAFSHSSEDWTTFPHWELYDIHRSYCKNS